MKRLVALLLICAMVFCPEAEKFVEEYWRDPRFNDDEVF